MLESLALAAYVADNFDAVGGVVAYVDELKNAGIVLRTSLNKVDVVAFE